MMVYVLNEFKKKSSVDYSICIQIGLKSKHEQFTNVDVFSFYGYTSRLVFHGSDFRASIFVSWFSFYLFNLKIRNNKNKYSERKREFENHFPFSIISRHVLAFSGDQLFFPSCNTVNFGLKFQSRSPSSKVLEKVKNTSIKSSCKWIHTWEENLLCYHLCTIKYLFLSSRNEIDKHKVVYNRWHSIISHTHG